MLVVVRVGRALDLRQGMLFQLLHHHFNCFLQLRVAALPESRGIKINFHIGRDTVILDFPIAVQSIDRGAWRSDMAAVNQFGIPADPH